MTDDEAGKLGEEAGPRKARAIGGPLAKLAVAAVVAAGAIGLAFTLSADDVEPKPAERPARVLDVSIDTVRSIRVKNPRTGLTVIIERDGDAFRVPAGTGVGDDRLDRLIADLFPLLAIRSFDDPNPDFGLDPPSVEVTVVAADDERTLRIGGPNFDETGYYASADTVGLVVVSVAETLIELVDG